MNNLMLKQQSSLRAIRKQVQGFVAIGALLSGVALMAESAQAKEYNVGNMSYQNNGAYTVHLKIVFLDAGRKCQGKPPNSTVSPEILLKSEWETLRSIDGHARRSRVSS